MRIFKRSFMLLFMLTLIIGTIQPMQVTAAMDPMLKKYFNKSYGDEGKSLRGYIPALNNIVERDWKLYQWKGVFSYADGTAKTLNNYDAFNVKRDPGDPSFDKENGLGLTFKSQAALGDLFDFVWGGKTIAAAQKKYFRDAFIENADDPAFRFGHEYYYLVEERDFLRTAGIVPRMGVRFDKTTKVTENDRRALYDVSAWPEMSVTTGDTLKIDYTASGYSPRYINLYAIPRGSFPDLKTKVVKLNKKTIQTDVEKSNGTLSAEAKDIVKILGTKVDIVLDDGYGRTAIKSVTLPDDQIIDYRPMRLSLLDNGQLWIKASYKGEDILTSDYVDERGMPMTVTVTVSGAAKAEFTNASMYKGLPASLSTGDTFQTMLGKVEISDAPGTYKIKAVAKINNPSHPDRALESPVDAYSNNTIEGEWTIVRGAENDLIAQSITASPSSINKGDTAKISAKIKNAGATTETGVTIRFFDNGKQIYETQKTLPPNSPITVGPFDWTGATTGTHNLSVHVDPDKQKPDSDRSNNIATTGCVVNSGESGSASGTCNKTTDNGTWTVSYPLITGYPTKTRTVTWTDNQGNTSSKSESYTDYSDPIWETRNVAYSESLSADLTLNTKQGIPTKQGVDDPSYRESRGSWEIIPWAAKNGLNPNEVTRAGYGFEIKVTTKYTNDWETKVPKGLAGTAKPIGGQYYGPASVHARIYDSKGKYVKRIELEKTSGDRNSATWEIPEETFRSKGAKPFTVTERKFYTDVMAPDGKYTIVIASDNAGQTGLTVCATKYVTIYGSMYDDTQNLKTWD